MDREHAPNTMTVSEDNPFRAPQSSFDPTEDKATKGLRVLRICIGLQCTTIVLGVSAAFYDIESIVVTGPVLFLIGIFLALCNRQHEHLTSLAFGLSGPAISIICLALINLLNWSPTDAQHPVSIIAAVYTTIALPTGLFLWTRTGSDRYFEELQNRNENALIADDGQHATKKTG